MTDRLRRFVVQNAETSRLLGVDFVPMYRRGGDDAVATPPDEPIAEPKPAKPPSPAAVAPLSFPVAGWLPTCTAQVASARTREQAQAAMDAVRARYEAEAPHRNFKTAHHSIVWGEGDVRAGLMFVGEAPGEEEDKCGRPFVGRAGQLLDKMIAAMGLKREAVYIANVLKTRPPGNATPTTQEAEACAPYLFEQISIIGPRVVVTLGLPATRLLLRTEASMSGLRGRWAAFTLPDGREIPVMPTYHPAYVLRSYTEEVRGKVWSDLKMAMDRLNPETVKSA